jgi:putative protein-disulfide isomerase
MSKDKIIYVFDPMCGWCFGFGKVMTEFEVQYKDSFDFGIISGGMVVGEREGPVGDFADYILGAYKRVEEYSGIKFGQPYIDQLKTKSLWSSSVKPSVALETFKTFNPEKAIEFGHEIQKAYFVKGKDLRDEEVYKELIKPYNIDEKDFIAKLNSDEARKAAADGFQTSANWGVTGFPAVIMVHDNKYYAVARGYTDLETLTKNVQSVLAR